MKALSEEQIVEIIDAQDVTTAMKDSAPKVAMVFSQSWCPQWLAMKLWLERAAEKDPDLRIHYVEYDKSSHFHPFMNFKEAVWKNDLVPYVRYYGGGEFLGDSNFCSQEHFEEVLKG